MENYIEYGIWRVIKKLTDNGITAMICTHDKILPGYYNLAGRKVAS